jgi:hypothetical protein
MQMNWTTSDISQVMKGDVPQALYIDSNLSRAMYSPFCNLTYHQLYTTVYEKAHKILDSINNR